VPQPAPKADTPMVVYMWAINLQKGDRLKVALKQGDAVLAENTQTLDHDKAQMILFAGKKTPQGGWPQGGWPQGSYTGEVTVTRDGKKVIEQKTEPITFD
jgi:hypothetical protein